MVRRSQETYALTHFRQHTSDNLTRIAERRAEPITQNGETAMLVRSPKTYDGMRIEIERGQFWDRADGRIGEGQGRDEREVTQELAAKLGLKL